MTNHPEANWDRIETLFHELADQSEEERRPVLEKIRSSDPDTYDILKTLLAADEKPNRIFVDDPQQLLSKWDDENDLIGTRIGAFRLDSIVGVGAMGTVFRASRADGQFDQTVAIKLLKSHMSVAAHRELFDRERQILAKLNHPGIARLYDGGFTDDGRPYFTMEWISGKSLTTYVRENGCSTARRLKLFREICEAVRYAHQSLIAHLDLKPANIIVNEDGRVKLLDFGVSRLMEENMEAAGSFTLAYAAPEQIRRESANAVSDIYSLGVILYEILGLKHPYESSFSDAAELKERILRGDYSKQNSIPKDLLMISQKAMVSDPDGRYGSVDEMISDIEAFSSHHPISIRRNDWQYKSAKYFRRHRAILSAVIIALAVLIGVGTYYTLQLREQRNIARSQAKKANEITDLLTDVFMAADPNVGGADTITAVNLLDQGARNLEQNLKDDPQLLADMQLRLTEVYYNLGQYEKGRKLAEDAYALLLAAPGSDEELIAISENQVGTAYYYYGDLDSAEIYILAALDRLKDYPEKAESEVDIQMQLGNVYYDQGRAAEADSLYRLCYATYLQEREAPHIDLAISLHMIGATSRDLLAYDSAEIYFKRSLAMKKELFEEPHLEIAYTYNYLGSLYQNTGDLELALDYINQSLQQRKAILGEYHVETMASMANTGRVYNRLGRYEEAAKIYDRTLVVIDSLFGKTHYYYAGLIGSQAISYMEMGEYDKARANLLESLRLYKELNPTNVLRQVSPLMRLGELAEKENNLEQARSYYEEVLSMTEESLPAGHPQIAQSQQTLGECLLDLGDYSTAIKHLEAALKTFESDEDPDPENLSALNTALAKAYTGINDLEKAGYYQNRLTSAE